MSTRRIVMIMGGVSFLAALILRTQGNSFLATVATSVAFSLLATAIAMRFTASGIHQAGPPLIGLSILFIYRSAYLSGYSAATNTPDLAGTLSVVLGIACMAAAALVFHHEPRSARSEQ
ncbi:MAG: hypothetical protein IT165_26845 [Bryobacterales bacterium]|nr:hypothetical protein [Bryobacterales bacterium]